MRSGDASSGRSRATPPRSKRARSRSRTRPTTAKTIPRRPIIPRRRASADVHARTNSVRSRSRRVSKRQVTQNLSQMLADLPTACDVGCKKNSKGYKETWTGYKLHIDVACGQIPVSCVLTSASVHDSQVAIPLMTMTSARVSYLYDLMDAAYDAAAIHDQSRALGHAPIVDRNFRADHEGKAEWGREVERPKLIHMPDFDDLIYDFRTMAERVNARLKDEFGARFLRVRGALKVKCHRHPRARRRSDHPCRRLQDRPCLTQPGSPPPGTGKFTSLRVFCKKLARPPSPAMSHRGVDGMPRQQCGRPRRRRPARRRGCHDRANRPSPPSPAMSHRGVDGMPRQQCGRPRRRRPARRRGFHDHADRPSP